MRFLKWLRCVFTKRCGLCNGPVRGKFRNCNNAMCEDCYKKAARPSIRLRQEENS